MLLLASTAFGQTTTRVSVATGGAQGNAASQDPAISADGRYIAFQSSATNLVAGDTNGKIDTFVHDLQTGTTERVSVDSSGLEGDNNSTACAISSDGRYVAFSSEAGNLVAGDTNFNFDVFVRDRQLGTTERVSVDSAGMQTSGFESNGAAISANGRYVAFHSRANNLVSGDNNLHYDVFVRDRQLGTTEIVSISSAGVQGGADSFLASLSPDGRHVSFTTVANGLVIGDSNGTLDAFVRDRQLGTTERVSVSSSGVEGNSASLAGSMSFDGRYVSFMSDASNLVGGDTNALRDVFVRDRLLGTTERVSVDSGGVQGNGMSSDSSLSYDGRYVAFESVALNFVPGDTNGNFDVFVRDRELGTTACVSLDPGGLQVQGDCFVGSISGYGRHVAFASSASNLVGGDTNGVQDAFVRDAHPSYTAFCFGDGIDPTHSSHCPCGNVGAPGNGCAHSMDPRGANLRAGGTTNADDVVLASSLTPARSFTMFLQHDAAGDFVFHDGVLCAGGTTIRLRGRNAISGAASFPDPLWDGSLTLSQRGGVFPGQGVRRYYSALYRNASTTFCPPATANVTNGWRTDW